MTGCEEKVVLVTGAGKGYGREIAKAFAWAGARVAVNDLTPVNLDTTVEEIEAIARQVGQDGVRANDVQRDMVRAHLFDVAKKMPAQALVEAVLEEWGGIDILINNAGVHPRASLLQMDEWDWQRTLDVNLSGPFYLIQAAGRIMRDQGEGCIVNIGSAEALGMTLDPPDRQVPHAAALPVDAGAFLSSKSGLVGLSRAAAAELAAYGVRVNTVCPGTSAPDSADCVSAEQVAELVLFLCGPEGADISGQAILAGAVLLDEGLDGGPAKDSDWEGEA